MGTAAPWEPAGEDGGVQNPSAFYFVTCSKIKSKRLMVSGTVRGRLCFGMEQGSLYLGLSFGGWSCSSLQHSSHCLLPSLSTHLHPLTSFSLETPTAIKASGLQGWFSLLIMCLCSPQSRTSGGFAAGQAFSVRQ